MPPMSKLVVVVGATGGQGGSVVKSLLNNPEWKIRGLTRNPNGSSAQALAAKGVDMVAADLNDFNSLQAAFEGAHAIFAVTNFLDPFPTKTPEECAEIETNQGINMARAASQVPTLQHYIWSTLPDSAEICGDDYFIPHFCSKAKVDKYIKRELPELWSKATLLQIPLYGDNFQYHVVTPHALKSTGKYVHLVPWSPQTPITTVGSHKDNVGVLAKAIYSKGPGALGGKYVVANVETMTATSMLDLWSEATGKDAVFVQISPEDYEKLWPFWGTEMAIMYRFWEKAGQNSWTAVGEDVITIEQLGLEHSDFVSTKDAMLTHDWDQLC